MNARGGGIRVIQPTGSMELKTAQGQMFIQEILTEKS